MTAGESCDDGNTTSGDGCSSTCKEEFSYEIWFANNYEYGTEDPTCDNGQRPMCHDLKDLLATATESIDFAIYGYSLNIDQVAAVIKNRQDNGVVVRGIVAEPENRNVTS
jgi:cysteine-rich repeat protein